ncbi:protein phosphatase CheZ [Zavarzinia sp. CC-PAN008]|uniref:protein phosphatase CheZ n=1 Tax=Zavarzinia sp. CC-PAN008 TaxID=3243332 RepID=UPI003F74203A
MDRNEMLAALKEVKHEIADLRAVVSQAAPGAEEAANELRQNQDVRIEIARMVREIGRAKRELASIRHPMSDDDRMSAASNELDAIVLATETATHDILDASEKMGGLISDLQILLADDAEARPKAEALENHLVTILEACNFQDITGQRITKVVRTLRFVEERVMSMIGIWGVDAFVDLPMGNEVVAQGDEALLNGPQLANQGLSQDDIDALFG